MQNPYDLIADIWHKQPREFRERRYVDRVLDRIEAGETVVDLGCGTGVPVARYVVGRGFDVVGIDSSQRMLSIARHEVPDARFLHGDMCDLAPLGPVAAVIAWDSVFHLDRRRHGELFRRIRAILREGGWLLLSAGGTGDAGFTSEMHGQTFYYSSYEPDETVRLLEASGLAVELCEIDDPSSRGHIAIVARAVGHGA